MVAATVTLTANQFFKLMRENAADRPSALYLYASYKRWRKVPELAMNAEDDSSDDRNWLINRFGKIPPELLRKDWDT